MEIREGHKLLDVGCGAGIDTVSLARLVGATGSVTGVDCDAAMIAEADRRAESAGVRSRIAHLHADAASLPFDPGGFDACRSERLFQHLLEPQRALAEMIRVTRPGGRVVVLDTDWGTASVGVRETDLERRLLRFFAERTLKNGYSGRHLHRMFLGTGLSNVSVEAFPVAVTGSALVRQIITADRLEAQALAEGVVSEDELRRWRASLAQADAEGGCFFCATLMLAQGTKPG